MEEEEPENLEIFLKWATQQGVSNSPPHFLPCLDSCLGQSICVSNFPDAGGRGLAAARDLKKGELILSVPKSTLMTRDSLLKDYALSVAVDKHPSLSSTQVLIVCLLNEVGKGKSSWWYPYLMQIPRSYHILATFGQFEMLALQVEDAIWAAEKAKAKAEVDWKESIALMKELKLKPQLLTFRAWVWAFATISSRTMHIPWDNAGCLCPVGDFFNYDAPGEEPIDTDNSKSWRNESSSQENSLWKDDITDELDAEPVDIRSQRLTDGVYQDDVEAYCFYARRNYRKGEQVLLSYGTYTNLELLEHYGFLLNENPNDKAFIPLEPEIYSLCSWPKDSLYIHQNGKPSFALLCSLRLWATPVNKRKSIGHLAYAGSQLSAKNETIVMELLAKNCNVILKSLQTSIEEDKLLLCIIDKFHDCGDLMDCEGACRDEVYAFLEAKRLLKGEIGYKSLVFKRIVKCTERWKSAVQWRLRYKQTLDNCISFCTETIKNDSISRTTDS